MMTSLQRLSFYNNSWRKFSLNKLIIVLFFVVLISFTNYAYGVTVGILPIQVAINPITDRAYVSHADGTVHVINTVTEIDIATIFAGPGALTGITVNPVTNKVYVVNTASSKVIVIDGSTNTVQTSIPLVSPLDGVTPVGIFPVDVEVNTILGILYVSNILSLTVVVIDINVGSPTENQIIDVITGFDSPARFAFDPNTNLMYMTNFLKNEITVLDGTKNFLLGGKAIFSRITIGSTADGLEINPISKKIYVANSGGDTVSVIDVDTDNIETFNTVIKIIPVGVNPIDVGVDPTNNKIYVSNKNEGTFTVINGETDQVEKTIPADISAVIPRLRGLEVHPVTGDVYVINSGIGIAPGTVSIIEFNAADNPPVARAGPDQVVNEAALVTLDGTGSFDPDGDPILFTWVEVTATGTPVFPPTVALSSPNVPSPTFTSNQVNVDTLIRFALVVTDLTTGLSSIPDIVNVVVEDTTSFIPTSTLTDGVVSGNQIVGDVFDGTTYSLQIDTPVGALPNAKLQQLVLPVGVDGDAGTFTFTESPVVVGIVEPDINTSLFFDLGFSGVVDFSESIDFITGNLPKIQFLIDKNFEPSPAGFEPAPRFVDGCLNVQLQLFDDNTGQWGQVGNSIVANTNKIYVSNAGLGVTPGTLFVIDGSTNNVIDTITLGFGPKLVAFDQNANKIYVANQGPGTVTVIDGSTNNVITTITVGLAPLLPLVNPNTSNVYVTNQGAGTVSVIDGKVGSPTENTVIATITTGITPSGIDIDTTLNKIYVGNTFGSSVSVIDADPNNDGTFNTVIATIITAQPSGIAIDSSNNRAYVSNFDDRLVSVIDTTTNNIIATIPVGSGPSSLSFNPSTSRLYVPNQLSSTVSIIDTEINAEIATVATGSAPFDVAVNPNTNRAYVADRGSGTVSVIDGMPGSPSSNRSNLNIF